MFDFLFYIDFKKTFLLQYVGHLVMLAVRLNHKVCFCWLLLTASSGFACRLFAALWVMILIGFMQVMIGCYFMTRDGDTDSDNTTASVYGAVVMA